MLGQKCLGQIQALVCESVRTRVYITWFLRCRRATLRVSRRKLEKTQFPVEKTQHEIRSHHWRRWLKYVYLRVLRSTAVLQYYSLLQYYSVLQSYSSTVCYSNTVHRGNTLYSSTQYTGGIPHPPPLHRHRQLCVALNSTTGSDAICPLLSTWLPPPAPADSFRSSPKRPPGFLIPGSRCSHLTSRLDRPLPSAPVLPACALPLL